MVFNLLVGHRCVFALHCNASELITLDELKRELYSRLADGTAVTLCIHFTDAVDLVDIRAAFSKLYVVLAYGLYVRRLSIKVDLW